MGYGDLMGFTGIQWWFNGNIWWFQGVKWDFPQKNDDCMGFSGLDIL